MKTAELTIALTLAYAAGAVSAMLATVMVSGIGGFIFRLARAAGGLD